MKKLLVLGGSGLLGSRICRQALLRGWQVVSISKTGRLPSIGTHSNHLRSYPLDLSAPLNYGKDHEYPPEMLDDVKDCAAAVHSIGSLFESDRYKRFVKSSCSSTASPEFTETTTTTTTPFETLHTDTLRWLLQFSAHHLPSLKAIGYISVAERLLPFPMDEMLVDRRYYSSKREAERLLFSHEFDGQLNERAVKRISVRPGFMFTEHSPITLPISGALSAMNSFKRYFLPSAVSSRLPSPPEQPLHVDTVANSLVESVVDSVELETVNVSPGGVVVGGRVDEQSVIITVGDIMKPTAW